VILAGLVAARFAHYVALSLLFGAAAFRLLAREAAGPRTALDTRLRIVALWSSLAALVTAALVLALTAAAMAGALGGALDPAVLGVILGQTDFGRVWALRMTLAAGLALWLAARPLTRTPPVEDWAVLVAAGGLAASLALTGHAQITSGAAGWLHRLADALHLLAAAVWLGALPAYLWLLGPARAGSPEGALSAGRLLQRFHRVGLLAVSALILSGLVNSWFLVGSPEALPTTPYGRLLLLKVALLAAMVALAADNRLRLAPRLNAALAGGLPPEIWLRRLRGRVRGELLLGLGVLLAVGALGVLAPPSAAG